MSHPQTYDFLVGTFNTPHLYTIRFTLPPSSSTTPKSPATLKILHRSSAIGSHSWLHLSPPKSNGTRNLYATAWTDPPTVVAYAVHSSTQISLLGTAQTNPEADTFAPAMWQCTPPAARRARSSLWIPRAGTLCGALHLPAQRRTALCRRRPARTASQHLPPPSHSSNPCKRCPSSTPPRNATTAA